MMKTVKVKAGQTRAPAVSSRAGSSRLAESVYAQIKSDIFDFRLMPGQRFSENELAGRLGVSRTPVREALNRLGQEGLIQVEAKSGWTVRSLDFKYIEDLYDLRVVLETAAVRRLCERVPMPQLGDLRETWLIAPEARDGDGTAVSVLDEQFHSALVLAAGNAEMSRVHDDITERIRVIRRLDFMYAERIRTTYSEHAQILRAILRRKADQATMLLRAHIETSKSEVRKISLHKLFEMKTGRH
jgi:DNA-binding GntR family transcriptional regulator